MTKLYQLSCRRQWRLLRFCLIVLILCSQKLWVDAQQVQLVQTDLSQKDFLKAYKCVFDLSDRDYRSTSTTMNKVMFSPYGEYSVYWITSGANKGSFVVPDTLPSRFASVTSSSSVGYNWQSAEHRSIQFKNTPKKVAIFKSKVELGGYSINWEAQYFKNLFETFLYKNAYYFVNEDNFTAGSLSDSTTLLIIPAFTTHSTGDKHYIDSIFSVNPQLKTRMQSFLSRGGTIYTEGNAAYIAEKLGYLSAGAVNFNDVTNATGNSLELTTFSTTHPIAFAHSGVKDKVYCSSIPNVTAGTASIIARLKSDNRAAIFELSGSHADGGRIVCNLGIPTVGGISEVESGSHQLQWTLNAILYAFSERIDVTRSVFNVIPPTVIGGDNSISYDRVDTFEVRVKLRNLSNEAVTGVTLTENFRNYFTLLDVFTSEGSNNYTNGILSFSGISLPPLSEKTVVYRLTTPSPENDIHEKVDKLIDYGSFIAASLNTTGYSDSQGKHIFGKQRDYADVMFSARLFGDADINWKNFLGLHWQPFKVFMIMENKERTQAENTVYTQYIPKDMPFYRSDGKLNIPVVKTPGGTFIDVLKGSDDRYHPEYDMDGDGDPDVWLDTTSIYPKGYKIETVEVYYANPWKTLEAKRAGLNKIVYEDINHNGIVTKDDNGDGIYETEDPGDKIRAWKITWPVGTVKGYEYFDPYCSAEVWVDAPDMVAMAQGVSYAFGKTDKKEGFYPYKTLDAARASHSITDYWTNWMDKNNDGTVQYSKMYHQKMYNYQGYAFMDSTTYQPKPWDEFFATVPHPHEEFVAVLSMGGEEIDMYHPTPSQSLYSKINYNTIFNEQRETPIRTTYSFYAPLPNPLQFEYLASNYSIMDTLNNPLTVLPAKGKAKLKFDLDASTEYSYYWIRNVGHKVDKPAPWIKDAGTDLGSGVFGYMIYEIPKGMAGYKITLPKKPDGTYDTDAIVQVDGKKFDTWLSNPNTGNAIEIWEDPFSYQVYIPQLLIPPALCDKNGDGVDDWIDDLGDRYKSNTGYLNDPFMAGNGEGYPAGSPHVFTHVDDGITVTGGWSSGADNTYGSDKFDELGRTHFTINALYEGKGKEGPVDISKGGTLVVEEIFGGSPWVIFSHVLTANAEGVDYKIKSSASPISVKYGLDTVYIKHTIEDANEPHEFNGNYDPYRASFGSSKATVTSMAGGKDPCDWVLPNYATTTIIDPVKDHKSITLIPEATHNTALTAAGYPKNINGTFLEVKVEVMNDDVDNGISYEWLNTTIKPDLSKAGASKVVLSYVSYPRPLVPGDQPATDTTGWRFNQPEGEVLIQLGDTMKSRLQTTRRAYFVYLISIDETLKKGIYTIGFTLSGDRKNYKGTSGGKLNLAVAPVKFSIVEKGDDKRPKEYQKFKIGEGSLTSLNLQGTEYFEGLNHVRWSTKDVDYTNFKALTTSVPATYSKERGIETIDLSKISRLPNADSAQLYLLEKVAVNSYRAGEDIDLTSDETLSYAYNNQTGSVPGNKVSVSPYGPKILISQKLYSVNGVPVADSLYLKSDDSKLYLVTKLAALNVGSDLSSKTIISIHPGPFYSVLVDSLPSNVKYENGLISADLGALQPGETKFAYVYYTVNQNISTVEDFMTVIRLSDIEYKGTSVQSNFKYTDPQQVLFEMYDFQLQTLNYSALDNRSFSITSSATNRGLPATNVWFRIYPVIGGGISEFPIAEKKIENFASGQTVELTVPSYTAPNGQRIEVVAKIDDGNKVKEIMEQNNAKVLLLAGPLSVNDLKNELGISVYPNPFADVVYFTYNLKEKAKSIQISVFTQGGSELVKFVKCPNDEGSHVIEWVPQLANGNYIYRISITAKDGSVSEVPGILIKTDK